MCIKDSELTFMTDVVDVLQRVKHASYALAGYGEGQKNAILKAIAEALACEDNVEAISAANRTDIALARQNEKNETFIDRLTLTSKRFADMIDGLKQVEALPDPVGEMVESRTLANGLDVKRVRAPLGVVGIIYEARPNVTVDAAALCIKSGNGVVLRGSKDALNTNRAIYAVMQKAIADLGAEADIIGFIDDPSREAGKIMLEHDEYVDVVIPRGGEGLKNFVLEHAAMPVIASAGGNCHVFVDVAANQEKAIKIVINAKCQRPSTCNAAEHLLVDARIAEEFIPKVCEALRENGVAVLADARTAEIMPSLERASDVDYATEFLTYTMTVKIVDGVKEAVDVINRYGTRHSEAIISEDVDAQRYFAEYVDAAAVYINASTRFTDGYELGLGAEMGISTQKLHVRGPIALKELTSVKYVVTGNGQIRK